VKRKRVLAGIFDLFATGGVAVYTRFEFAFTKYPEAGQAQQALFLELAGLLTR
jgi:hypothetical protein